MHAMSDASFASLGPTLLARKGGAKPAMRPQVAPFPGMLAAQDDRLEDLGWNDMGEANGTEANDETGSDSSVVREQRDRLAKRIAAGEAEAAEPKRAGKKTSKAKAATTKASRRAAFTLRLDPDRHLKLRLAATMNGKSAQALVTEALDTMLSEIADLEALAKRVKPNMTKEGRS